MSEGYIKLYRTFAEHPLFGTNYGWVFLDLLLNATHKPVEKNFGGKIVTLQPGQCISGVRAIGKRTKLHRSSVERALKFLKNETLIETQTATKGTMFTIVCWEKYQTASQDARHDRDTSETRPRHNKNDKNIISSSLRSEDIPVYPGCEFFRCDKHSYGLAQKWFRQNNQPLKLIPYAIQEVEKWLSKDTKGAIAARKGTKSHHKYLYESWVLEKALRAFNTNGTQEPKPFAPRPGSRADNIQKLKNNLKQGTYEQSRTTQIDNQPGFTLPHRSLPDGEL